MCTVYIYICMHINTMLHVHMFIDRLDVKQVFDQPLPVVSDRVAFTLDTVTGEQSQPRQFPVTPEGSYSTKIQVRISGNVLYVSGNPSRYGRPDNLQGFTHIDDCFALYNRVLSQIGLPPLTKCTRRFFMQQDTGKASVTSDGAIITALHITTNRAVGQGNELAYIKGLATLSYKHSHPHLYSNGCTVEWRNINGKISHLQKPMVYCKAAEMDIHLLPKIKRKYGGESAEYKYVKALRDWCAAAGVVRFEQQLKSRFLQRENLNFWGLSDMNKLHAIHSEFVNNDKRLKLSVSDFELQTIADRLLESGICDTVRSANTTAQYALLWSCGQTFDFNKKQVQTHRARLRKIGIDIKHAFDYDRHNVVHLKRSRDIEVKPFILPDWYQMPSVNKVALRAV